MIGSHNTFTYMRPSKRWMYLLIPFARCQSRSIAEQAKRGAMLADMRVRYVAKERKWYVCHGLVTYCTINDAISRIFETSIRRVRILIEGDCTVSDLMRLQDYLSLYPEIFFYEGKRKSNWTQVLHNLPSLLVYQYVGSMQSWYGKICPWLYTAFNKARIKRNLQLAAETQIICTFDFL